MSLRIKAFFGLRYPLFYAAYFTPVVPSVSEDDVKEKYLFDGRLITLIPHFGATAKSTWTLLSFFDPTILDTHEIYGDFVRYHSSLPYCLRSFISTYKTPHISPFSHEMWIFNAKPWDFIVHSSIRARDYSCCTQP